MTLLELDDLTRRFGGLVAVDGVSMRVEEGEVRAIIGPNGAGKSTLFNLITGVLKPTRGSVSFAGESVTGLSVPRLCQRGMARTFQLTALFPEMSARENVRLAAQARERRRWQSMAGSGFRGAGDRADAALERSAFRLIADRPAGLLSHGDQRLLEVAMALAQEPRLLLLDEPTQGLSVRGDGAGSRNLVPAARREPDDRSAGGARHGGRVPARAPHHGAASRRGHRGWPAGSRQAG